MQANTAKQKLIAGQCIYGTSLRECLDPEVPVALKAAGLDNFFVDTEHARASYAQVQGLCRSARASGVIPLVRVTNNEPYLISRAFDVGAMGVIVPRIHSPDAARAVIDAAKFAPIGHRGFGLSSIITDFHEKPAHEEVMSCNQETMVVLQIESKEGLACVEQIANIDNVDVVFIGPYDLTLSLGMVEQFHNPIFWEAVDRVVQASEKAGKAAGIQFSDMNLLYEAQRRGVRFLLYSSDLRVLLSGYKQAVQLLRQSEKTHLQNG